MITNIESLTKKLIKATKKTTFSSGGIRYSDPNYNDYFFISDNIDFEAEFACEITNIEMALDIIELAHKELDIDNFDRDLTKGKLLNHVMKNYIPIDSKIYLNYIKTPSQII